MAKLRIRLSVKIILIIMIIGLFFNISGGINMHSLKGTIVFTTGGIVSEGGEIYLADIKNVGTTIKNIFKERVFVHETAFSPDTSLIIFLKDNMTDPLSNTPRYEIMITDREGKNYKKVLDMGKIPCGYASWSPDGSKIAFLAGDNLTDIYWGRLYTASIDGSNIRKVTDVKSFACRPIWMPDGKRIIFTTIDKKLCVINSDGTDLKEIAKGVQPSLSPDGKKIAFRSSWNIYICDTSGKNKKMLIWNYNRNIIFGDYNYPSNLTWSPDEQYLLYTRRSWWTLAGIFTDMIVVSTANSSKKVQLNYMPGGQIQGISWAKD